MKKKRRRSVVASARATGPLVLLLFLGMIGMSRPLHLSHHYNRPRQRLLLVTPRTHHVMVARSSRRLYAAAATNENDNDTIDLESVSDADALLACHRHLVRTKRFKWTEAAERKELLNQSPLVSTLPDKWDADTSFFWEKPNELKYLYRVRNCVPSWLSKKSGTDDDDDDEPRRKAPRPRVGVGDPNENLWDDFADEDSSDSDDTEQEEVDNGGEFGIWGETVINSRDLALRVIEDEVDDDNDYNDDADEIYQIREEEEAYLRRSQVHQLQFSDPAWKAKWYEKRWGGHNTTATKVKRQAAAAKAKLQRLDPDRFLASSEMAALTPEEIEHAIRTYFTSQQKRLISRQRTMQERRAAYAWPEMDSVEGAAAAVDHNETYSDSVEALLQQNFAQLKEARRQRSERAKKAYQTRLARKQQLPINQTSYIMTKLQKGKRLQAKSKLSSSSSAAASALATTATLPEEALQRIEADLQQGRIPAIDDVELVLRSNKLARRKRVLTDMLRSCFNLRGKCIPETFLKHRGTFLSSPGIRRMVDQQQNREELLPQNDKDERLLFMTHCPVDVIGAFCLHQLRQREEQAASDMESLNSSE